MTTMLPKVPERNLNGLIRPRGIVVLGETISLRDQAACDSVAVVSQPSGTRPADVDGLEFTPWAPGIYLVRLSRGGSTVRDVELVATPSTIDSHPMLVGRGRAILSGLVSDPAFTADDATRSTFLRPWPTLAGDNAPLQHFGAPGRDVSQSEMTAWQSVAKLAEDMFVARRDALLTRGEFLAVDNSGAIER